jgi:predicted DNA-binding protein
MMIMARLVLKVSVEMHQRLVKAKFKTGRNMTDIMRTAIEEYLNKLQQPQSE